MKRPSQVPLHRGYVLPIGVLLTTAHFIYFSGLCGLLRDSSLHGTLPLVLEVDRAERPLHARRIKGRLGSDVSDGDGSLAQENKVTIADASSTSDQDAVFASLPPRHFIAVSSDDWGRWVDNDVPIWRDSLAKQLFSSKVKSVPTGPFANNAAESHDDIDTLFDVLQRLNENATNRGHVVLSPFWVVGGPDYASMSATGCPGGPDCAYKELLIDRSAGGLSAPYYKRGDLRRDYQAGFRRRLWYPQYHGRSHLNHGEWTASLKSDEKAQAFFNEGLATADQSRVPRGEYAMYQDEQQLVEWIKGGVDVFTKFWGFQPRVTLEPNHVCTPVLPAAFKRAGFEGVDSCYCVLPSASNNLGQQMELIERDADGNVVKVPPTMRYYADYSFGQGLECIDPRVSIDAYKGGTVDFDREVRPQLERVFTPNKDGFAALSWHQQNILTSTYTPERQLELQANFMDIIRRVRAEFPHSEFVTAVELHQLHARGWSMLPWSDGFVYRNSLKAPLLIKIANIHDFYEFAEWRSDVELELRELPQDEPLGASRLIQRVYIGDEVELDPGRIYTIALSEASRSASAAVASACPLLHITVLLPFLLTCVFVVADVRPRAGS